MRGCNNVSGSRRVAILIGVNEHEHSAWSPLSYVLGDIEGPNGLRRALTQELGASCCFGVDDVHALLGEDATSGKVEQLISQMIGAAGSEDLILIYFSGHATVYAGADWPVLVTYDTDPLRPHMTGLSFNLFKELLKHQNKNGARLILITDSCFSGRFLAGGEIEAGFQAASRRDDEIVRDSESSSVAASVTRHFADLDIVAVFASCQAEQVSGPAVSRDQSLFTKHLIAGLCGDGKALRQGRVDTTSLRDYLMAVCRDTVQQPAIRVPDEPLVLAIPTRPLSARGKSLDEARRDYLDTFCARYEDDPIRLHGSFVEVNYLRSKGVVDENGLEPVPAGRSGNLLGELREAAAGSGDSAVTVVLGDVGSGKTTIFRRLWFDLAKLAATDPDAPLPILVPLDIFHDVRLTELLEGDAADPEGYRKTSSRFRGLLTDLLQNEYGLPIFWDELVGMCGKRSVVFLFDGLDEMGLDGYTSVLSAAVKLITQFATYGAKVILSCRRHYLREDSELYRALAATLPSGTVAAVLHLKKFSPTQARKYIDAMSGDEDKAQRCHEFITHAFKGTQKLAERPFLLEMLVLSMDLWENRPTSEHDIFEQFLKGWLKRDRRRFVRFLHDFRDTFERANEDALVGGDLYDEKDADPVSRAEGIITQFIEILADDLRLKGKTTIPHQRIRDHIRQRFPALPEVFLSFFEYTIRTCSFLVRNDEGVYEFLHSSVHAYFAARAIRRELRAERYGWDREGRLSNAVVPHSLGRQQLGEDVVEFLRDMLIFDDNRRLTKWLRYDIGPNVNTLKFLGGNCLTLLCLLKHRMLRRMNLSGAFICGAELSGANLTGADLRRTVLLDSDLSDTTLQEAKVEGAKFIRVRISGANLRGVEVTNGDTFIAQPIGLESARNAPEAFLRIIDESKKGDRKQQEYRLPIADDVKMVEIPGGRFWMGTDSAEAESHERPAHEVEVGPFMLDVHPVTNSQFAEFVKANPEWGKDCGRARTGNVYYLSHWEGNEPPEELGEHPVVYVSWHAAYHYAEWAGKRLPNEAEWEFALRNGHHAERWDYPWCQDGSWIPEEMQQHMQTQETYPVGRVKANVDPNCFGLYDMSGNVNEWVHDWFDPAYWHSRKDEFVRNPTGPDFGTHKVLRGGSFLDHDSRVLRCCYRRFLLPANTNQDGGFRCAI